MARDFATAITIDAALAEAAAWRGLSPAAYVRTVVAEAIEADTELAQLARESLGPDAAVSREALHACFDALRTGPDD